MKARIAALIAAAGAAAAAAGAAAWAKREADEDEALEAEIFAAVEAEALAEAEAAATEEPRVATIPVEPEADDLTVVKGIGAVSAERLSGIGITSLAQLAAWSDADVDDVGPRIKISPDRIRREDWVGQARAISGTDDG